MEDSGPTVELAGLVEEEAPVGAVITELELVLG